MRIRFLGAARAVTGSMHLLETKEGSVLIDCGMFQGKRDESRERNRDLPKAAVQADVLVLTHAHIDHSGNIPTLVKNGFRGDIWATPATRDLCAHMLADAAKIQRLDAEYLNRKFGEEPGWVKIEPLFDEEDVAEAMKRFMTAPYGRRFRPLDGLAATFYDAGHILGSAGVLFEGDDGGKTRRVVFSGDIGRRGLPILRDPQPAPPPVDYVVMESTYGNRVHGDVQAMHEDLERVVKDTIRRGGKIIVPAFSVGRTQEIIYTLSGLKHEGRLPEIPVYIDSPLSVRVTDVFKLHPECFDKEARAFLDQSGQIFDFDGVKAVTTREESIKLNSLREPAIIISASGMCEAGRVLHHLKNNVEDPRNTILIVGFQAQHTLGRRLVERRPKVRILGVEREVHARVEVLNAFSAHADKNELLWYAQSCGKQARKVFLVHGEPEQQEPFLELLRKDERLSCEAPERGEVAEL